MWRFWRKRKPASAWLDTFVQLTDDDDTDFPAMRDHMRLGLESMEVTDRGAALVAAQGIARAMSEEIGDSTALECLARADYPGFIDAWERGQILYEQTVAGHATAAHEEG